MIHWEWFRRIHQSGRGDKDEVIQPLCADLCIHAPQQSSLDMVSLYHDDYEWLKIIDYVHVPFHYRKCHTLGHLFRDCPSNLKSMTTLQWKNLTWMGSQKFAIKK